MLVAILFATLLFAWLIQRYLRMTLLQRNGIPGPKPHLIFGNNAEIEEFGRLKCHQKWYNEYGPIVGFYDGGNPFVMVADIDLVRKIQVKDFEKFSSRPEIPMGGLFPGNIRHSIILENGHPWVRQRRLVGPNFSTTKLRKLTEVINPIIESSLSDELDPIAKSGKELDWSEIFQKLTFSITTKASFGFSHEFDVHDPMFDALSNFTNDAHDKDIISRAFLLFPEFWFILYPIRQLYVKFLHYMLWSATSRCDYFSKKVVESRVESGEEREDLLQYLIDSNDGDDGRKKKLNLSETEVVANTMGFLLAGYETSSTALTYSMHYLVKSQELQERILAELEVSGDPRNKMPFLEAVINETLRLHPSVANFVQREALVDYKYKEMTIPCRTSIVVGVVPLHSEPKHWIDPDSFNPDRFLNYASDNYAYQGFGAGPRQCLGMRLAMLVIKLTICYILTNYRPVPSPSSELDRLTTEEKYFVSHAPKGVWSKLVPIRSENRKA